MDCASAQGLEKLQLLLDGGSIFTAVDEHVSFRKLKRMYSDECFFSMLYLAGYLTRLNPGAETGSRYELQIPNCEVMEGLRSMIAGYYRDPGNKLLPVAGELIRAALHPQLEIVAADLNQLLSRRAGIRKPGVESSDSSYIRELLSGSAPGNILIKPELGAADGSAHITIYDKDSATAAILAFKQAGKADLTNLLAAASAGLLQIKKQDYVKSFKRDAVRYIYGFGIGCKAKKAIVVYEALSKPV